MPNDWCLIFSDGTGQRGVRAEEVGDPEAGHVRNTNIYQMYAASDGRPTLKASTTPASARPPRAKRAGLRTARNLWSKATGWGITANIADCYEALLIGWKPGMKIGFFGFSRGAYTVRCLGGVLATCGIATRDGGGPISADKDGPGAKSRRKIADEAVAAYKIKNKAERKAPAPTLPANMQPPPTRAGCRGRVRHGQGARPAGRHERRQPVEARIPRHRTFAARAGRPACAVDRREPQGVRCPSSGTMSTRKAALPGR